MAAGDITTVDGIRFLELSAVGAPPIPGYFGPSMPNSRTNPEQFKLFIYTVNGEVAYKQLFLLMPGSEGTIAAMSSDPKVIEIPVNMLDLAQIGYMYADGVFSRPVA